MAQQIAVVLNTFGGRLTPQEKIHTVEQALKHTGLDYQVHPTEYSGHGIELARQAAQAGSPVVVAAGGDGTVNEVVNGLMQAAGEAVAGTLGIIPLGTANDLADALDIPRDLHQACERLAAGRTRLIDVGQVNERYFVNNSAIGLEAMVTMTHDRMRWVRGNTRYILAAVKAIITARPWQMDILWDDDTYTGPTILVSVGNTNRTGGEFYMTPHAKMDDGLLDFVFAEAMPRWQLLRLLPQTFSGAHIHHPRVVYKQTTTLAITAAPPTPIQADGEIFDPQASRITYRLIPGKLRVIS